MMISERLAEFGRPRNELQFKGPLDWLVHFHNPQLLYEAQPSFFVTQSVFLLGALVTLLHAIQKGGRFPWLWFATILHGATIEFISYNLPDMDNFWHAQTPIIFLGLRLPLYIVFLYPVFIYHATIAVSKLKLSNWAEPFAVGLLVVLIDLPYDIVGIRFNFWSWHDTDPNLFDRHYWVPWNSYYFHATFTVSFIFVFHGAHRLLAKTEDKWQTHSSWQREFVCCLLAALFGMPGGVLLFLPIYHPLHDFLGIHSEVTTLILLTIFVLIFWTADRQRFHVQFKSLSLYKNVKKQKLFGAILLVHLAIHYLSFLGLVIFGQPGNEISIGIHEQIGPCNEIVPLRTAFGSVLEKRKYLCIEDFDEAYFDFKCLNSSLIPKSGSRWYIHCGVPFDNRAEYIVVLATIALLACVVFVNLHLKSGPEPEVKAKPTLKSNKKFS